MGGKLPIRILSYEQIREEADRFLAIYNQKGVVPVPIEEIVEFSFKINIIPVPGLQRTLEVDGFISSDLKSITVDQFVMEERVPRYRFTLAHELGHAWLHKDILQDFNFDSVDTWKNFQIEMSEEDYGWLEFQAHAFAGLVLVPKEPLAIRKEALQNRIKANGLDPTTEAAQLIMNRSLAVDFNVSPGVIERRIPKDR